MSSDQFQLFIAFVISGVGLFLLGLVNIACRNQRQLLRLVAHAMIVAAASGGVLATDSKPEMVFRVSALLTTAMFVSRVIASSNFQRAMLSLVSSLRRPAIQAGMLALGGIALIGYGIYRFERDEDQAFENDNNFIQQAVWKPNLHSITGTVVVTDKGRPVNLQTTDEIRTSAEMAEMENTVLDQLVSDKSLIRLCGPDDRTNCHGWVFTGGRNWLPTESVESILEDNGYRPVTSPAVGDLAIYREANSKVLTHTAIVRIVSGDSPVVESKWGWMGVFLHAVDRSCYGTCFTYYHSDRNGHILAGLAAEKTPETQNYPTNSDLKVGGH